MFFEVSKSKPNAASVTVCHGLLDDESLRPEAAHGELELLSALGLFVGDNAERPDPLLYVLEPGLELAV